MWRACKARRDTEARRDTQRHRHRQTGRSKHTHTHTGRVGRKREWVDSHGPAGIQLTTQTPVARPLCLRPIGMSTRLNMWPMFVVPTLLTMNSSLRRCGSLEKPSIHVPTGRGSDMTRRRTSPVGGPPSRAVLPAELARGLRERASSSRRASRRSKWLTCLM